VAVARLYDTPQGSEIEDVPHPLAYAYTALLRSARGDEAGSERAISQIPDAAVRFAKAVPDSTHSRTRWLLSLVHATAYYYVGYACPMPGGSGAETWCGAFDEYPEDALAAFVPMGGSGTDSYSDEQKRYCVGRLVTANGSEALARKTVAALTSITPALYDIAPHPNGTGYSEVLYQVDDALEEPIFLPAGPTVGGASDLSSAIDDAGRYIRDIDVRVRRFRRFEATITPTLGAAICRMAEHRRIPMTLAECNDVARARVEAALGSWLAARPYAELRPNAKGDLVEPKPWR
jgi:hypothetical protein